MASTSGTGASMGLMSPVPLFAWARPDERVCREGEERGGRGQPVQAGETGAWVRHKRGSEPPIRQGREKGGAHVVQNIDHASLARRGHFAL